MDKRKAAKQMEMLWRGAESFGDQADVFTANFPTGNSSKEADWLCCSQASLGYACKVHELS